MITAEAVRKIRRLSFDEAVRTLTDRQEAMLYCLLACHKMSGHCAASCPLMNMIKAGEAREVGPDAAED